VSDGSSLLIGPLDFIPAKGTRTTWYRSSIPTTHSACDQVEVFAAGRRLRKDPLETIDSGDKVQKVFEKVFSDLL
jgi:hypothetical protein